MMEFVSFQVTDQCVVSIEKNTFLENNISYVIVIKSVNICM